jgi:hypothetical protein
MRADHAWMENGFGACAAALDQEFAACQGHAVRQVGAAAGVRRQGVSSHCLARSMMVDAE